MALLFAGCSSGLGTSSPRSDGVLASGTWGGDNAGVIVTDSSIHVHIGCTYGDVSGRVQIVNGAFDAAGSYMLRAYPVAVGPAVPARFSGKVTGNSLTISVIVDDTVQHQTVTKGPATVTLGKEPQLGPCPICRRPPS